MSQDVHTSTCQHPHVKVFLTNIQFQGSDIIMKNSLWNIYRRTYWLPIGYWSQLIYYYQVRNIYYVNFK